MTDPRAERRRLAVCLAVVLPLGIASKLYAGPGSGWVQGYAGGVLYEMFWILAALVARPGSDPLRIAVAVFAITCGLEALQLWHPPALEAARATALGAALLGSTFSWWDFPHYALGCAVALGSVRLARASPL